MKTFFYMGRNSKNVSGVSWKIWKIGREGRMVTTMWGPASLVKRRVTPTRTLQSKSWKFRNVSLAQKFETSRIKSKLGKGYERKPRLRN